MQITKLKQQLYPNFYDRYKIITGTPEEEQKWQDYFQGICQRLLGPQFNLEEHPICFCISDKESVNAYYLRVFEPEPDKFYPPEDLEEFERKIPCIVIHKGMLDFVQNEDQLAFYLGHELGHWKANLFDKKKDNQENTKIEEAAADLQSLEMMVQAGYNINEAYKVSEYLLKPEKYTNPEDLLIRSFDAHVNNEDRLLALGTSIRLLDAKYAIKEKDLDAFETREIPTDIQDDFQKKHFVSQIKKDLALLGYYEVESLSKKQDILFNYVENVLFSNGNLELKWYPPLLREVLREHILSLMVEIPRTVIRQSDYDLLTQPMTEDEKSKLVPLWQQVVGRQYSFGSRFDRAEEVLKSFPYQIVPDEEYEKEYATQEEKRKCFYQQIETGENLPLLFWDRLMNWADHGYAKSLFLSCASLPLLSVPQIDLKKTSFGQKINSYFDINEEAFSYSVSVALGGFKQADFSLLPPEFLPYDIKCEHHIQHHPFYRFTPDSFPQLNLEMNENDCQKSMPVHYLIPGLAEVLGIRILNYSASVSVLTYTPDHFNPFEEQEPTWCYFIEKGKIIDSFPYKDEEDAFNRLQTRQKRDFQQRVAGHIKDVYALFMKVKENPKTHGLSAQQLELLKLFTGPGYDTHSSNKPAQRYFALLNDIEEQVSYEGVNKEQRVHSFLESEGCIGYLCDFSLFYDEEILKSYLTEEEQAFFFGGYNLENDECVFQALRASLYENPKDFEWLLNVYSNIRFSQTDGKRGYECSNTNRQVLQYLHDCLNHLSPEDLQNQKKLQRSIFNVEYANLKYFAEKQMEENPDLAEADVDFSSYSYLIMDELAEKLGIPVYFADYSIEEHGIHKGKVDFSWNKKLAEILQKNKIADKGMDIDRYKIQTFMLAMYILTDKTHTLPLGELFIDKDVIFPLFAYPCFEEKFMPALLRRENYPQDSVEALTVFKNIVPPLRKSKSPVFDVALDIILEEKDAMKSVKAAVLFLNTLSYYQDIGLVNPLKDRLCSNLAAFREDVPLETRIDAYLQLAENNGFSDDYVIQNRFLNRFLDEIQQIDNPIKQNELYTHFILLKNRITDPDLRRAFQRRWVDSVFEVCGAQIDDNSAELHEKISKFLSVLHGKTTSKKYKDKGLDVDFDENNVAVADQYEIARLLADKFVSQEALSMQIKPKMSNPLSQNKGGLQKNHYQVVAWDTVKYAIANKPEEAERLMDFLLSGGTLADCQAYRTHLSNFVRQLPSTVSFQVLYREFWQYPLEVRSVLLCSVLGSASQVENVDNSRRWEAMFNIVAPRIFPDTESTMHQSARSFLHSYIKSRKPNERGLYLAAMLVAANGNKNAGDPDKCMAVGIRLFLENSGPAAIKLGQAMASCPDVPAFIREELDCLKSQAARPARWELYEWLQEYRKNGDDTLDFGPSVWLGNILGSASYFVTLEKGQITDENTSQQSNTVIKILRGGARELAKDEFNIFEATLKDLARQNFFPDNMDTFIRLVQQAKESSNIETDLDIGYSQFETAQDLYGKRQIAIDGHIFNLHVCDWLERGKNWAVLERADGSDLKKITDPSYKKSVSQAYFTVELMNILSGSRFDHDRHGEQLKINTETNTVQLFDTGAMAVVDPTLEDKQVLGRVVYRIMQRSIDEQSDKLSIGNVAKVLTEEIDKVYKTGEMVSSYLTEFQRGLLALKDFYVDLTPEDIIACFNTALNQNDMPVDKHILSGFVREGIHSVGIFESSQHLLTPENKEILGRVLFIASAIGMSSGQHTIQDVLKIAVHQMKEQQGEHPLLNIVSSKISSDSHIIGLDLPKEFIPTIQELVASESNLDMDILKGAVKEVIDTINLQEQKDNYSPEDRQAFGRLLYDTYSLSQQDPSIGLMGAFLKTQKEGKHQTQLGCKMAAIVRIIQSFSDDKEAQGSIRGEDLVRAILLSGRMDTHITKGIVDQFEKTSSGNQLKRSLTAKGLQWFLSQEKKEMGFVKRMVRWKLGVKPDVLHSAEDIVMQKLADRELQRKLTESVKKIICDFVGGFIAQNPEMDNSVAHSNSENPQTSTAPSVAQKKAPYKFLTRFLGGSKT